MAHDEGRMALALVQGAELSVAVVVGVCRYLSDIWPTWLCGVCERVCVWWCAGVLG